MHVCLADRQDISRAGLMYVLGGMDITDFQRADDKAEMIEQLKHWPDSIVVLDYTLFDINDVEELEILSLRFPLATWILFSVDLSADFVKRITAQGNQFSVLLKDASLHEVRDCLRYATKRRRYICQSMTEVLLRPDTETPKEDVKLTRTETEILKDIAMGMTTKEIAEKRFSSFHTVNTHRKNIFHKLGVNSMHEATKFALRSGLVDAAEYYI